MLPASVNNGRPPPPGAPSVVVVARAPTNGTAVHAPERRPVPWHEIVRVAARASVDPTTVQRYLSGRPCRATTSHRIAQGLIKCGLELYVRKVV